MSRWLDGKKHYLMVGLTKDKKVHKVLVHRLVAQTFIPNPDNLPEVNHKNKNMRDCRVKNLEWCTRRQNLEDSYTTMSPVRNYRECVLFKDGQKICEFPSILAACRYAENHFNSSYSMLAKHRKHKNVEIVYKV